MVGPVDYVPELDDSDDDDDRDPGIFADPASPRHQFLIELVRMRDLPPECVLLRRDLTTTLNLSHRGLGDGVGEVLVKVLPKLPELGELLLADNRWTDVAIGAEIDRWFGLFRPNFKPLELGQTEVDSAGFWTNRSLSSSPRSGAEALASNLSMTRTLKSG